MRTIRVQTGAQGPRPSDRRAGRGRRQRRAAHDHRPARSGDQASAAAPGGGAGEGAGRGRVRLGGQGVRLRLAGRRAAGPQHRLPRVEARLLRDAGVPDGWLHDARHTAATVLLLLGVPDVVVDSIMGWEPGGAARMRARYMHITGPMLRKVARQVGERCRSCQRSTETGNVEGPRCKQRGPSTLVPGEALAEDTRFELVRGCPQHAFQACALGH